MMRLRFLVVLWACKLVARLIQWFFPQRGTNQSGKIALRLMPGFLDAFRGIVPARTIFVTGTNGKSTSNNLIVHAFRTSGKTVATNLEGANLVSGVATTLIKNSTLSGWMSKDYLILEVDERTLPRVRRSLPGGFLCVTNLQKDQVQRNGDPDYIYRKILSAIGQDVTVFVNNEEPRTASLARAAGRSVSFGVARNERSFAAASPDHAVVSGEEPTVDPYAVTMPCPLCHDALGFSYYNLAGVGPFHCRKCGFSSADTPDYQVGRVDFRARRFAINRHDFHLEYDAAPFLYNYALCAAVAGEFGIGEADLDRAFRTFTNVGGRLEEFAFRNKKVCYVRIKQENPETLQSALDTIAADPGEKVFALGLEIVRDIIPNYNNTSYAFDVSFDRLLATPVETCVCYGKTNCYDVAVRLLYAGFPEDKIVLVDSDEPADIFDAIARCRPERAYLVTLLGQYEVLSRYVKRRA